MPRSLDEDEEYGNRTASTSVDGWLTSRSSRRATRVIIRPLLRKERRLTVQGRKGKPARGCTQCYTNEVPPQRNDLYQRDSA